MRVAVVSDIHGNLSALEAVLADLYRQAPDAVYHGGDLATSGARPGEVVDRIRELGWKGVVGNTDELLWRSDERERLTGLAPALSPLLDAIFDDIAPHTREALGAERIDWLKALPAEHRAEGLFLVHATPGELWYAPPPDAKDEELAGAYMRPGARVAVYGHIHRPYVRTLAELTVANSGGAGMSYDGDPRAAYLLIDDGVAAVQRVEYGIEREVRELRSSGHPHADWIASILRSGEYTTPAPGS